LEEFEEILTNSFVCDVRAQRMRKAQKLEAAAVET
jgi:hypothetical protein